jgi:transcriptional regulator with XRE-family HTH domain
LLFLLGFSTFDDYMPGSYDRAPPSFRRGSAGDAGNSQLQLAMAATCSRRHVSFLKLGRTKPSRDMVLRLSCALDLPLRQFNGLLLAAGYASVWTETDLGATPLAPVHEALDYILAQQEPFPAVVVDRRWNLHQANKGVAAMV